MDKSLIINKIKNHLNIKTDKDFAEYLDIKPTTLAMWRSRNTLDVELIFTKCEFLNPEFLLTGKGDVLKKGTSTVMEESPEYGNSDLKKKIPLYEVETIGGVNDYIANTNEQHSHVSEWIDAGDWFPDATAAIRHYGNSMVEYPSGSILVLKRVEDLSLIIWGRNYSIETNEFRITKRLQNGGDECFIAYSSNKETYPDGKLIHEPIAIRKSSVRHIDLVLGCVMKEYSNGPITIIKQNPTKK